MKLSTKRAFAGLVAGLCLLGGTPAHAQLAHAQLANAIPLSAQRIPPNVADGTLPTMAGRDIFDLTPLSFNLPGWVPLLGNRQVSLDQSVFGFDVWSEDPRQDERGRWYTNVWRYHWQWGSPNPMNDRVVQVTISAIDQGGHTYWTQVFDNRRNGTGDGDWFNALGAGEPLRLKPGLFCATLYSSGVQEAQVCHGV